MAEDQSWSISTQREYVEETSFFREIYGAHGSNAQKILGTPPGMYQNSVFSIDRRQGDFGRELRAVFAASVKFHFRTHRPRLRIFDVTCAASGVDAARRFGHQKFDLPADELVSFVVQFITSREWIPECCLASPGLGRSTSGGVGRRTSARPQRRVSLGIDVLFKNDMINGAAGRRIASQ